MNVNKILASVLLILSFSWCNEENSITTEQEIHPAIILLGLGVAPSNQRMEFDILNISGGQPFKDFNLYLEVYPRFDIRLDSKAVSLGNIAIWLAMAIPINAIQSSDTSGFLAKYFITGSLWLASGSTHFVLLGDNLTGLSIFENHLFEWWVDKGNDWNISELGYMESFGLQANLFLSFVGGGILFEITNRRKNFGFFFQIKMFPIFGERPPKEK